MDEEQAKWKKIAPIWSECNIIEQVEHYGGIDDENYYCFTLSLLDDMDDCLVISYDLTKNQFTDDGDTWQNFAMCGINLSACQRYFSIFTALPVKVIDQELVLKSKLTREHLIQYAQFLVELYTFKQVLMNKDKLFEVGLRND